MKDAIETIVFTIAMLCLAASIFIMAHNATTSVLADQPHINCECRELTRIRLLLEHQFGVVCDERHCEGQSSSGGGSSLP